MSQQIPPLISTRAKKIQPFYAMKLLARAKQLEAQGQDIVHMEIGEPDFTTPQPIIDAASTAMQQGDMFYTPATGLPQLREAIAQHYNDTFNVTVNSQRIIVTPGASGGLFLVLSALLNVGDQLALADPGYPCNRHFANLLSADVCAIPVAENTNFQLNKTLLEQHWNDKIRVVLLASPANPTGTCFDGEVLRELIDFCQSKQAVVVMDEIYQQLVYETEPVTALSISDEVVVVNSFSKYFCMTGWRIGWVVAPKSMVNTLDNLAQNLFLAAATPSQYAALAAFKAETVSVLERRKQEYKARRDYLIDALQDIGLTVFAIPQGAFYIYVNVSEFTDDSLAFSEICLEDAGVAVTPGIDFGHHNAKQYIRLAYTTNIGRLKVGVARLKNVLS